MITSASAAASASDVTRSPASSALRLLELPLAQGDPHVDPGLPEVLCVGVALGAVAQDGDLAAGDQGWGRRRTRSTAWPWRQLFLFGLFGLSDFGLVGRGRGGQWRSSLGRATRPVRWSSTTV